MEIVHHIPGGKDRCQVEFQDGEKAAKASSSLTSMTPIIGDPKYGDRLVIGGGSEIHPFIRASCLESDILTNHADVRKGIIRKRNNS